MITLNVDLIYGAVMAGLFSLLVWHVVSRNWYTPYKIRKKNADTIAIFMAIHDKEAPEADPSLILSWLNQEELVTLLRASMFRMYDLKGKGELIPRKEFKFAQLIHSEILDRYMYSAIGIHIRIKHEYYGDKAWLK